MAFIPEDGTGKPDANSYVDVGFADGYFADRNNETWEGLSTEQKQSNLIAATDYIDFRWGGRFKGYPETDTQALFFPRTPWVGLPMNLKKATCEYAVRVVNGPLAPDIESDPSGYQVSRKIDKVGPLEERRDFAFMGPGATRQTFRSYPAADSLIVPLLRNTGGGVIRNG